MTGSANEKCLYCERSADEVPLLVMWHKGQNFWICPEHLPILIHKPGMIADRLPGAANLTPHEGH